MIISLARSREFNVWLLIACVSETFMSILARAMNVMFGCLARGHEVNVLLLIACVSENFMIIRLARGREFNVWLLIACVCEKNSEYFGQGSLM